MADRLPLSLLSSEAIEAVHNATLRILNEVGVVMTHPEAQEILSGAGSRVDGDRLRIPPDLVDQALAACPKTVSLVGRGGTVVLGDGHLHWHNLGGARDVFEPENNRHRPAAVRDVIQATRLLDALPNCTAITPFFTPQDVPGPLMSLAMYRHTLPHTTKPVHAPGVQTPAEIEYLIRMAEVVGEPAKVLAGVISSISPLTFPDALTAAILAAARAGLLFEPLPCPTAGMTAPLSLAGALAQQNAEVLAAIVLAQTVNPGLPLIYCGRLSVMEPRSGASVWGGVELGLVSAATVQIAHRYGLPANVYGFSTNAHDLDLQSGYERALNAVIPALAGADELSGIGETSAGVMGAYTQMVIDDEIAAGIRRARRGIKVDADSLAVDVIAEVMVGSRNFVTERHTVNYLRAGEVLVPQLAERREWEAWDASGQEGIADRAWAKAERLLAEHEVEPLSPVKEAELEQIMRAAESQLT